MRVITKIIALIFVLIGILYPKSIKTIAVLDLEAKGISASEASVLTDRLRSELINVGKYIVVDRKNMEEILQEQGFQQSGCTSDECVAEVGQLLGVQFMLSGTVGKFGKTFTIQLQILNIETGVIEQSSTYDYEGALETLLKKGIHTVLLRLLGIEETPEAISALHTSILELEITPQYAVVLIDGIEYKPNEVRNIELLTGNHFIEVNAPYYFPYTKNILVKKDMINPLNVELKSGRKIFNKCNKQKRYGFTGTITAFGVTALSFIVANYTYSKYQKSTSTKEALSYRNTTTQLDELTIRLSYISGGLSLYTLWKWIQEKHLKHKLGIIE